MYKIFKDKMIKYYCKVFKRSKQIERCTKFMDKTTQ